MEPMSKGELFEIMPLFSQFRKLARRNIFDAGRFLSAEHQRYD
jgi:hypothetical protein